MTRRRQIVRRAVMVLAVPVLLAYLYVLSYLVAQWSVGRQLLPGNTVIGLWYAPIELYEYSNLPGGAEFLSVRIWFVSGGARSLKECREWAIVYRGDE
jgi:hypothetical protein